MQVIRSAHSNQIGKKAAQTLGVLSPVHDRKSGLSMIKVVLLISSTSVPLKSFACHV
jgi:hypothetical protein